MILRLVLGDQLNPLHSWFREVREDVVYALFESGEELRYAPHHRQKMLAFLHGMQQFALHLRQSGHRVEYWTLDDPRQQGSLRANLEALKRELSLSSDLVIEYQEPDEYRVDQSLLGAGRCVPSEHFLTERGSVAAHFTGKKTYLMESFYRAMRVRHGVLLDSIGQPEGGTWNFDSDNRASWDPKQPVPAEWRAHHDVREIDARLDRHEIPRWGDAMAHDFPWPCDRSESLALLSHFIEFGLPLFGRYQDALAEGQDFLFHSRISFALNTKMLHPREVIEAAETAWRRDPETYPLPAVEGFIRQILGWREYIFNCYWRWMPEYAQLNKLNAHRPLAPLFTDPKKTKMKCVATVLNGINERAYSHHIERLMVLGNFALISGTDPQQFTNWMWNSYIDAHEWVMVPNVLGMSLYADGGQLATKPYASGGAYIDRMSNHCDGCAYDRKKRTGDDACPFTNLYWDFHMRHEKTFVKNPRIARQVRAAQKLSDIADVQKTAKQILERLDRGAV